MKKHYFIFLALGLFSFQFMNAQWTGTGPVTTTDNVGIGTNAPQGLLHILKNGSKGLLLGYYGNDIQGRYGSTGQYNGDLILNYWAGNVGIGTASPSQKLHVAGDSYLQGKVYIGNTDTYLYSDEANRITTHDKFYVTSSSPATYLYSANTYLGGSSDKIHLRGNVFDWTSGGGGIINASGNVGIGTTSPGDGKLYVAGKTKVIGSVAGDMVDIINNQPNISSTSALIWGCYGWDVSQVNNPPLIDLTQKSNHRFIVRNNGQVGINCDPGNSSNMLTVNGKIVCEEIEVKDVAADYVFEKGYNLRSLTEVENFIAENGHLPDVAPACETAQGVELAKFNTLLLQKIEELTLYIIEQDKRIDELAKNSK